MLPRQGACCDNLHIVDCDTVTTDPLMLLLECSVLISSAVVNCVNRKIVRKQRCVSSAVSACNNGLIVHVGLLSAQECT